MPDRLMACCMLSRISLESLSFRVKTPGEPPAQNRCPFDYTARRRVSISLMSFIDSLKHICGKRGRVAATDPIKCHAVAAKWRFAGSALMNSR